MDTHETEPVITLDELATEMLVASLRGRPLPADAAVEVARARALAAAMLGPASSPAVVPQVGLRCPKCGALPLADTDESLVCEPCNTEWRKLDHATTEALGMTGPWSPLGEAAIALRAQADADAAKLARLEVLLDGKLGTDIVWTGEVLAALAGTAYVFGAESPAPVLDPPTDAPPYAPPEACTHPPSECCSTCMPF